MAVAFGFCWRGPILVKFAKASCCTIGKVPCGFHWQGPILVKFTKSSFCTTPWRYLVSLSPSLPPLGCKNQSLGCKNKSLGCTNWHWGVKIGHPTAKRTPSLPRGRGYLPNLVNTCSLARPGEGGIYQYERDHAKYRQIMLVVLIVQWQNIDNKCFPILISHHQTERDHAKNRQYLRRPICLTKFKHNYKTKKWAWSRKKSTISALQD